MPRRPAPPLLGPGLVHRRLRVDVSDVFLVKAVVEAHEGVANVFGESGGDLVLAAPTDREAELDALLVDLERLIGERRRATISGHPPTATSAEAADRDRTRRDPTP